MITEWWGEWPRLLAIRLGLLVMISLHPVEVVPVEVVQVEVVLVNPINVPSCWKCHSGPRTIHLGI